MARNGDAAIITTVTRLNEELNTYRRIKAHVIILGEDTLLSCLTFKKTLMCYCWYAEVGTVPNIPMRDFQLLFLCIHKGKNALKTMKVTYTIHDQSWQIPMLSRLFCYKCKYIIQSIKGLLTDLAIQQCFGFGKINTIS